MHQSLIEINENELDREWYEQPKLVLKYGLRLAELKKEAAETKAELERIAANLETMIRANPAKYGIDKVTESQIKSQILLQAQYVKKQNELLEAEYKVDQYQILMRALEHRKGALENAVKLHGQGYFAEPKADDQSQRAYMENAAKKRRRGVK